MNEERSFERFVADNVAGNPGGDPMPEAFYDDMHTYASHHRQRPEWLAFIKEPPMRTNSKLAVGSPTMRVAAIMVATLLLAVALAAVGVAGSRLLAADGPIVVNHDGTADYITINEAVTNAEDGDEILVMAGEYEEAVRISKDITLRGEDRDSVIIRVGDGCVADTGTGTASCPEGTPLYGGYWMGEAPFGILVDEAEAIVSDLTIQTRGGTKDSGSAADADDNAITVVGGAPRFSNVSAVHASRNSSSVYVHAGSEAEFSDSLFEGWVFIEEQSPAKLVGSEIQGMLMVNTNNTSPGGGAEAEVRDNQLYTTVLAGPVILEGNEVTNSKSYIPDTTAIQIQSSEGWTISDNTITGFFNGISGGSSGDVLGNDLIGNDNGISVKIGPGSRVASNRIEGGETGLRVDGSGRVEDNEVRSAQSRGIVVPKNATLTLTGNTSCDNGVDLFLPDGASSTIDETNTFCDRASSDG
jgi:hypothetical protein